MGRSWSIPATGATSIAGLFAGGDCLRNGGEVVDAVQDGKIAALRNPRDPCSARAVAGPWPHRRGSPGHAAQVADPDREVRGPR